MNRTMTFKGFLLILVIVLTVFFILHTILKNSADEQRQKQQELRVQLTRLEEENKELLSKLNLAGTDEYIMANAVKKYSYVKKDAIRFAGPAHRPGRRRRPRQRRRQDRPLRKRGGRYPPGRLCRCRCSG